MKLRTSFRGKLFLLAIVPLAVAQLVTLFAVMNTVEKDVDRRARESLKIGGTVVGEYLSSHSEQLKTSIGVLAADFGLKEAAATQDAETIRSVLRNHSQRVGADIAVLLDLDGNAIASTSASGSIDRIRLPALLDGDRGVASQHFVEVIGDVAYQVFSVPLRAPTTIGWVVVGFRIDEGVALQIAALTGLDIAIVSGSDSPSLIASTGIPDQLVANPASLLPHANGPETVFLLAGLGTDYIALGTPFISGNTGIQVILLRSLKAAMAPYVDARRGLMLFAALLLASVAAAAAWVSGSIAKPLRILRDAAKQMISGQYNVCVYVPPGDEIGELASSFNAMLTAISEREERIFHQASHDSLTDLPNRNKVIKELSIAIENARSGTIAVFSIRLARMNEISSTLGHSASDDLINLAARHLRLNLSHADILGHVGTNEFVVVRPGSNLEGALASAEKIESILGAGVTLDRVNIALRTEIGIAIFPEHGRNAAELLRNAMIARSEAQARDEAIATYVSGREDFYVRQLRIVNDLRGAIQKDELRVHYQPRLALPTGTICGAEALVRWQHAEYGWLSPDEFVPAAEEAGTIVHLTRHVMRQAISYCRAWEDSGYALQVSVNISARDLQDEYLPYYVLQLMKEHGLPPQRLTLEVTENSVMQKIQKAITVLECLRDIGVRISMDDFGTGHSSLAQIRNIPLHELKIDKSFVMTLLSDKKNEAIVRTTLQLAHNMSLEVVAEGVEDEETLRYLNAAGCEQAQGYYLSKPVSSADFLAWLERRTDSRGALPRPERRGDRRAFQRKA
ncbi:MAG: EAL domain-containing protein [Gammaproteobacteria bacterium]|nr:EAL domain-containing protein [Gammaproteobacteria bacterium]